MHPRIEPEFEKYLNKSIDKSNGRTELRSLGRISLVILLFAKLGLAADESPVLVVLGTAQDGGYPQIGCEKDCCAPAWANPQLRRFVSCLAVCDPATGERFLFDCTPDFRDQLRLLDETIANGKSAMAPVSGIFPTHAHMGHYTGLMHLGREVLGARSVPVYAMPRMKYFLESNGPWSQLVDLKQIEIRRLSATHPIRLNERLTVTPFLVPHRDEFSETVAFKIDGPNKSALYLPDIDKWERWNVPIESMIGLVDYAFLDGTFAESNELPGRDMSEIPHPFIAESAARFSGLPKQERAKIWFIHFNHSNPVLQSRPDAAPHPLLERSGMKAAQQGMKLEL